MTDKQKSDRFYQVVDYSGGSLAGYVTCSYRDLVSVFGPPSDEGSDGYKVSTSWFILDSKKNVTFELYDYKETQLYDGSYPSVDSFRSQRSYDWHVGGHVDSIDFNALQGFLSEKLGFSVNVRKGW
jgi:hypothetical protein